MQLRTNGILKANVEGHGQWNFERRFHKRRLAGAGFIVLTDLLRSVCTVIIVAFFDLDVFVLGQHELQRRFGATGVFLSGETFRKFSSALERSHESGLEGLRPGAVSSPKSGLS